MNVASPLLGDVLRLGDDVQLAAWGVADLDEVPIAELGDLSAAVYERVCASLGDRPRIHPSAYVSPKAIVHDDVVIGPRAVVHEFSTVRARTVISAGVHVGYGCEISRSVIGQRAVLSHRATIGCAIIGQEAYFATDLAIAVCVLSNPDMLHPTKSIRFALPGGGRQDTGQAKWGAIVGERVRAGLRVTLGPGAVIGADTVIHSGITVSTAWIPAGSTLRNTTNYEIMTPEGESSCVTKLTVSI
jgi:UDP-3-O-[3-hydroxymyristoyl] glucosamine N-acyltransferase